MTENKSMPMPDNSGIYGDSLDKDEYDLYGVNSPGDIYGGPEDSGL